MAWEKATIPWKETSGGKKERERVIRVEHGKRALISQLYWRKKRVRPAWTSIVGRRPLLSLCIIAFRSYRLERDKIQVSHDIIKKQLPLRVGGGSPLEWLGEKISRRLTHPVRRPIVLGAFVWLPISLRAVPWKNYSWRGYLRKRHFRQKITITQNATNWAIRCHRPPDQEKFSCEFQLTATQRRQDVNDFQFSSSFFFSFFYDYDYYDVGKGGICCWSLYNWSYRMIGSHRNHVVSVCRAGCAAQYILFSLSYSKVSYTVRVLR